MNDDQTNQRRDSRASAVLAGGCFWCVEAVFKELDGVIEVVSGYAGGREETADYKSVCTGDSGHAEAVRITYDPSRISFEYLLRVHFATHDPTQKNRQGNDVGPQYRSAIFYRDEQEKRIADAFIADLDASGVFDKPIQTTVEPLEHGFFPAEPEHQDFVACHPGHPYVRSAALPKVEKVRRMFADRVKQDVPGRAR